MSLLKFYGLLPLIPFAIGLSTAPYRLWKSYRAKKSVEWAQGQPPLVNFALLGTAKPDELQGRICPKILYSYVPYLHQGNIGADSEKEAEARIATFVEVSSIGTGIGVAAIPIMKYFSDCLTHQGLGTCSKEGAADFFSYAGIPLIAGAYLVSRIAKNFFIVPTITILTDGHQSIRILVLNEEYKKMALFLHQILDLPADDPKSIHTAQLAKRFLRIVPEIENEIHTSLAIDRKQAKNILIPVVTACRLLLAKHAYNRP